VRTRTCTAVLCYSEIEVVRQRTGTVTDSADNASATGVKLYDGSEREVDTNDANDQLIRSTQCSR